MGPQALGMPVTVAARESGSARVPVSQTRLCVGRHEPGSAESARAFGGARLAAGSLLARTCVGGPEPVSRIHTATRTDGVSFVHVGFHV
jgi:hypothetical protein